MMGVSYGPPNRFPTPGMPDLPPELLAALIAPPSPQDISAETQQITPEAAQMLQQELAVRDAEDQEQRKKALKAIFGQGFPLVLDHAPKDSDWERWISERWETHRPGVQHNIWMAERNRQFRASFQWQSRMNSMGAWREPPMPKDAVRIVDNRIRPALAWAAQVVSEQRPGWQFKPTNTDADRLRKAEAQQRAVEYQYDAQMMRRKILEAVYWAQTDGVSFFQTYWNSDDGPWEELEAGKGPVPLGEPCTKVYRIEQVRVSSEATATVSPMYWILRDILPLQQAVALYGPEVADNPDQALLAQQMSQFSTTNQYAYAPLFQNQTTVARFTVFCQKSQWLPQGLTVIVVGKKLVYGPVGLLMGRIPMVRITDGSDDPAFFPTPKMNLLIAPQMRVNMLWSKWYESIRKNSGGRFATKSNTFSQETFVGGETSVLEVRTSGDIRESIMPVQAFSVGGDIKEALDREIKIIEDLTGYNDNARGQYANDQSGRAIMAIREQLERQFAPQVGSVAEGMAEWAKQNVGWMRFGYQMPRKISILGKNRSDLATELTAADLDGIVDVTVDPETMIPQPKALKQWMLDNAFDRQIITKDQWLERSPMGDVRDMEAPSEIQYQKAMRVAEQIRLGQPQEPVVWQDDESINQNVLERDVILAGNIDPMIQQAATVRWQQLADQHSKKIAPPPPPPGSPEANYKAFTDKIAAQAVAGAEQLISQVIEANDFAAAQGQGAVQGGGQPGTGVSVPPGAPVVSTAGPPPAPKVPAGPGIDLTPVVQAIHEVGQSLMMALAGKQQAPPVVNVHPASPAQVHIAPAQVHLNPPPQPPPIVNVSNAPALPGKARRRSGTLTGPDGKVFKMDMGETD
jgi:hypothetical protein